MFVNVKYYDVLANAYASRPYAYFTSLHLKVGDVVLAPTAKAPDGSRSIVCAVDVPEPAFKCKEITKYYEPEA